MVANSLLLRETYVRQCFLGGNHIVCVSSLSVCSRGKYGNDISHIAECDDDILRVWT